jgi:alcohol dehydrogenase, propanol-preferring
MHVVAIDIGPEKVRLAQNLAADMVIDAAVENPAEKVQKTNWQGAHGSDHRRISPRLSSGHGHTAARRCLRAGIAAGRLPCPHFLISS